MPVICAFWENELPAKKEILSLKLIPNSRMKPRSLYPSRTSVAAILSLGLLCPVRGANPPSNPAGSEPIKVVVPATAGPRNPVKVTTVSTGQKVTVTIGNVFWKGGGTRATASANWRGYQDRVERNGLPWMALVFAIGKQNFLPDKKEFSFIVPAAGELVAFANDGNPDGNSGKAEATVTIQGK